MLLDSAVGDKGGIAGKEAAIIVSSGPTTGLAWAQTSHVHVID